MCSYITETAEIAGSAKGPVGWMRIDRANVYYDHPYHSSYDHTLNIDFVRDGGAPDERVAVELTADAARTLVAKILAALAAGEAAHDAVAG
jgi:hypothetical protein